MPPLTPNETTMKMPERLDTFDVVDIVKTPSRSAELVQLTRRWNAHEGLVKALEKSAQLLRDVREWGIVEKLPLREQELKVISENNREVVAILSTLKD